MEQIVVEYVSDVGNLGALIQVLVIAGARPLGFVLLCPVFSRFGIQEGLIRGGVLLALSMPALPIVVLHFATVATPAPLATALIICKELIIGVVLGLLVGLPFWAATAAGDTIDMGRGASMGTLVDPGSGAESTVTGTFLFLACVIWLIASGVFIPALFGPLYETYALYPIMEPLPPVDPARGAQALAFLGRLTAAGLILALPLVLPFLLLDVLLTVAAKYVQQISPMFLSMSAKQGIFVLLLLVYTTFIATFVFAELGREAHNPISLFLFLGDPR